MRLSSTIFVISCPTTSKSLSVSFLSITTGSGLTDYARLSLNHNGRANIVDWTGAVQSITGDEINSYYHPTYLNRNGATTHFSYALRYYTEPGLEGGGANAQIKVGD